MGLRVVERTADTALVESVYEGLAPMPPFAGPGIVNLGRIVTPRYISVRTVGTPGNLSLLLEPVNSTSRAGVARYDIRDGEVIILEGDVDYNLSVQAEVNGCVINPGVLATPEIVAPIPSAMLRIHWGSRKIPYVNPPDDQGSLNAAIRETSIPNGGTTASNRILIPTSGRASWLAHYAAGVAGIITLIQGNVSENIALAPVGCWTCPDLIAGQYAAVSVRNTGAAGSVNVDLKVVRT